MRGSATATSPSSPTYDFYGTNSATNALGSGVYGSAGGKGVFGTSSLGYGVFGKSYSGDGVYENSENGSGVTGVS